MTTAERGRQLDPAVTQLLQVYIVSKFTSDAFARGDEVVMERAARSVVLLGPSGRAQLVGALLRGLVNNYQHPEIPGRIRNFLPFQFQNGEVNPLELKDEYTGVVRMFDKATRLDTVEEVLQVGITYADRFSPQTGDKDEVVAAWLTYLSTIEDSPLRKKLTRDVIVLRESMPNPRSKAGKPTIKRRAAIFAISGPEITVNDILHSLSAVHGIRGTDNQIRVDIAAMRSYGIEIDVKAE